MALSTEAQNGREILLNLRDPNHVQNGTKLMVDRAVQYEIMSDADDDNHSAGYNGNVSFNSISSVPISIEPTISAERSPYSQNETLSSHQLEKNEVIKGWQRELIEKTKEAVAATEGPPPPQPAPPNDGPRYKMNESNPTTPGAGEPHNNTSTWRIRDRDRSSSGSEDDIEKMEDASSDSEKCIDKKLIGVKTKTEEAGDGETGVGRGRGGKPGGATDPDSNDEDCCIQCLSYAIQCCECVIS